ncbi:hypothetical protein IY40_24330 [Serratia marcescens]|nr:hypothetical protein IY40_24330 [Serratia marcescens]
MPFVYGKGDVAKTLILKRRGSDALIFIVCPVLFYEQGRSMRLLVKITLMLMLQWSPWKRP